MRVDDGERRCASCSRTGSSHTSRHRSGTGRSSMGSPLRPPSRPEGRPAATRESRRRADAPSVRGCAGGARRRRRRRSRGRGSRRRSRACFGRLPAHLVERCERRGSRAGDVPGAVLRLRTHVEDDDLATCESVVRALGGRDLLDLARSPRYVVGEDGDLGDVARRRRRERRPRARRRARSRAGR